MKRPPLWQILIVTTAEADEAVADLLQSALACSPVTIADPDSNRTTVAVYLEQQPDWRRIRPILSRGLDRIERCGLRTAPGRIVLRRIARERWAESWKRHFKPIEIGRALLIRPRWIRRRVRPGQHLVVLNPGLSFGTGQHPTTRFCLEQLVRQRRPGETQAFLDVGTGSGILAIAAAKLGFAPVDAFDIDPQAVQIARDNARRNRVSEKTRITRSDLARLPRQPRRRYSLVCANLIYPLLVREACRLVNRLEPGGTLVIAGILAREFSGLQKALEGAGLRRIARRIEGEWCSGAFASKC